MSPHSRIRTAVAAVAGVAALAAIAPAAQASYFTTPGPNDGVCKGVDDLHAIGASGLRGAKIAWGNGIGEPDPNPAGAIGFGYDVGTPHPCNVFKLPADGGSKTFDYRPTGSGSCINSMIGSTGPRQFTPAGEGPITNVGYCGTEDAPTEGQLAAAEGGPTSSPAHPAEAQFLTIPVAQVAVAITTRLPDGCRVLDHTKRNISRDDAAQAFEGTITTWGDVFGTDMTASGASPTSAECRAKSFKRVVRKDNSGTTFLLKRYLQAVTEPPGGVSDFDWRQPPDGTLVNNAWPNNTPGSSTEVERGNENGNGSLLDKLSLQTANGGIGYSDVSTARGRQYAWDHVGGSFTGNDTSIWLRVQRIPNDTYNSPGVSNFQSPSGGGVALGSACDNAQYSNQPTTDLGASWSAATAVPTPTDYSICGLNYVVTSLWGLDTENSRFTKVWAGSTAGVFRAARDYLRYNVGIIATEVGPSRLRPAGYSKLPPDVQATAKCAISKVAWIRASADPQPADAVPRGSCP